MIQKRVFLTLVAHLCSARRTEVRDICELVCCSLLLLLLL